jgi:hypothetical protein
MAAKIITFLLIFGINIAIGVGFVFFLMLALNGFSEGDAMYAFGIFIVGGLLVSVLTGLAGVFLVRFLTGKDWNAFLAVLLSVVSFVVLGFILKIVIFFIGILVADHIRTSR